MLLQEKHRRNRPKPESNTRKTATSAEESGIDRLLAWWKNHTSGTMGTCVSVFFWCKGISLHIWCLRSYITLGLDIFPAVNYISKLVLLLEIISSKCCSWLFMAVHGMYDRLQWIVTIPFSPKNPWLSLGTRTESALYGDQDSQDGTSGG